MEKEQRQKWVNRTGVNGCDKLENRKKRSNQVRETERQELITRWLDVLCSKFYKQRMTRYSLKGERGRSEWK